jgi:hypothetical protein
MVAGSNRSGTERDSDRAILNQHEREWACERQRRTRVFAAVGWGTKGGSSELGAGTC